MQVGFHVADITPALGMEAPGGYGKAYIRQIHDPLKVRASVFDDGKTTLALIGIDTCEFQTPQIMARIRAETEQLCGIPGAYLLMAASHTHSGGPLLGWLPEEVADAPEPIRDLFLKHSTSVDPLYL